MNNPMTVKLDPANQTPAQMVWTYLESNPDGISVDVVSLLCEFIQHYDYRFALYKFLERKYESRSTAANDTVRPPGIHGGSPGTPSVP